MDSYQLVKRSKHDALDRISGLPDPILGKILSCLPTKTAFSTSILSTRWKTVFPFWATPITLDLDDTLLLNPRENQSKCHSKSFANFVDNLFNMIPGDVEIVKLNCDNYYGPTRIKSWVSAALRLNVRDLTIQVSIMSSSSRKLFLCLSGCKTLTRLELGKDFEVRLLNNFVLPNLKILVLFKLRFDDMFTSLIDSCPVLEDLSFSYCTLKNEVVQIQSDVLRKLTIKDNWINESMCEFELDVPNLEVLIYKDWLPGFYYLSNFESLLTAHIDVGFPEEEIGTSDEEDDDWDENGPWYGHGVAMLVKACSSTAQLYLATCSLCALQHSPMSLPLFKNLTCLVLGCVLKSEGWAIMARLLCNAPKLEKLTFQEGFGEHEGGYSSFESIVLIPPVSLERSLKEIVFCVFEEEMDEFKLIEYFLKNGEAIQKLELCCMPCKKMSTLSRLGLLPRQSKIAFKPR